MVALRRVSVGAIAIVFVAASAILPAQAASTPEEALRDALGGLAKSARGPERAEIVVVQKFYEGRGFSLAWTTADEQINPRGVALVEVFSRASDEGLDPRDYASPPPPGNIQSDPVATEIGLSVSLLRYACDLRFGRVEPDPPDDAPYVRRRLNPQCDVLEAASAAPDVRAILGGMAPPAGDYARLKSTLARYRNLATAGGWLLTQSGPPLKLGMRDPRVIDLRRALAQRGDGTGETAGDPDLFDFDLETALRRFQARHGLTVDGTFGRATQMALDVPVETRINQLVRNMERVRWMPEDMGQRHILVNLADFTLRFVEGGRSGFETRVIVGTPYQRSPIFSTAITAVEINPYWHVPDGIARAELLALIQADPYYLADNNMRVLATRGGRTVAIDAEEIDWSSLRPDTFAYLLRQEPGLDNALGRIKFSMPNRWNIYLHDTPSRQLFDRAVRSFSHGCIRVQNPFELAARLLAADPRWTQERLVEAAQNGEQRAVRLVRPVPVHIVYFTAWTNPDGSVHFRDDIYGRDRRLGAAIARPATK